MTTGNALSSNSWLRAPVLIGAAALICLPMAVAVSEEGEPAREENVSSSAQAELLDRLTALIRLEMDGVQLDRADLVGRRDDLIENLEPNARRQIGEIDAELAALDNRLHALERELADAMALRARTAARFEASVDGAAEPAAEDAGTPLPPTDEARRIQGALIYVGAYDGRIDGQLGRRSREAIKRFQRSLNASPTGVLSDAQKEKLFEEGATYRREYGVRTLKDPNAGYVLDYPEILLQETIDEGDGSRVLASTHDASALTIDVREQADLDSLYGEQESRFDVSYGRLRKGWFVLAGRQDDDHLFYEVARRADDRVIHARLVHPEADKRLWDPFKVLLFNSFAIEGRD